MNTHTPLQLLTRCVCAAALFAGTAGARAADYVFSHTGFLGGATITGSFSTGADINNDGALSTNNPGEITALAMHFSGDSQVAAFSADMALDSVSLTFRPTTAAATFNAYTGRSWPAAFSWDSSSDGTASPYFYSRVFGNFGVNVSYTDRALGGNWMLMAAPVPEPAAVCLALMGVAFLSIQRLRLRQAAVVHA